MKNKFLAKKLFGCLFALFGLSVASTSNAQTVLTEIKNVLVNDLDHTYIYLNDNVPGIASCGSGNPSVLFANNSQSLLSIAITAKVSNAPVFISTRTTCTASGFADLGSIRLE